MLANYMYHTPSRLVCDTKLALQFLGRDAVARRREQEDRIEPHLQWRAGLLKRRPHGRVQVMAAPLAGIGTLGLDPIPVGRPLA